jgi:hypothetical protein
MLSDFKLAEGKQFYQPKRFKSRHRSISQRIVDTGVKIKIAGQPDLIEVMEC